MTRCLDSQPTDEELDVTLWWWCLANGVDVLRLSSAVKLLTLEARLHHKLVLYIMVTLVSISSSLLLGVWMIVDGQKECSELWAVWMNFVAFLNGVLCFLSVLGLLAGNPDAHPASSPPDLAVMPVVPDLGKRLVHLTLQTFTVDAQCSETDEVRECIICLNGPYCPGDLVTELHCHHAFHSSCIDRWIYAGSRGCPMRCEPPPVSAIEVDVEVAL